jgi:glycosyltransferase involved in cell wall biosynthesis
MSDPPQFVCAFRGRRDSYQVPLALAEGDFLDQFITDAYFGQAAGPLSLILPRRLQDKLRSRAQPGIPWKRVKSLWGVTVLEHLRHRLGFVRAHTFARFDRSFSVAAAARCRKTKGELYLYSPYAWEAFTARYAHEPKKILFQFHPHPDIERRILLEDREKYPAVQRSFEEESGEHLTEPMKQRSRDCWRHADVIICASSFTKQSLIEAGAPPDLCQIVPYGIDLPMDGAVTPISETFNALFVGTGSQRKGLHHLLLAWQKATLPKGSRLTVVCRQIDPGIEALAKQTSNVTIIHGASQSKLRLLFRSSSIFVLPSLVEGFGQVYLEALAEGCPVLGTANTGLPDLGGERDGISLVEPGQIDQLVSEIELSARRLPGSEEIRARARACAAHWTWPKFRANIRANL